MACFATILGVILTGFIMVSAAKDTCDIYGAIGQGLSLALDYKALKMATDVLRWTHNSTIIFYKQAGALKVGHSRDISATGSLELKALKFSNAGIYKADVINSSGEFVHSQTRYLCVMERVSKPQVQFACDFEANTVSLTCNVAMAQVLDFTWALNGNPLPSETKQTLRISLTQLKGVNNFTCHVSNKVSQATSDSIRQSCARLVPKPPAVLCFPLKTIFGILAGGGCLFLLLLIMIATNIMHCLHGRRQTPMRMDGKGEHQMAVLKNHHGPNSIAPDYESMHCVEEHAYDNPRLPDRADAEAVVQVESQDEDKSLQPPRANEEEQKPSPVPKPRTKAPQNQGE